jgi:hypothetical protein
MKLSISKLYRSRLLSRSVFVLVISSLIILFLAIPLRPFTDTGFWSTFYSRWNIKTSFRIVQSIAHMAPSVGFGALISYLVGSFASDSFIGTRHSPRVISLCFTYSLYGAIIGFIMGATKGSVAAQALTSIVTIVAAAFGYLISKDLSRRLKAMVPPALTCFLLTLMFSAHYYASLPKT